MNKPTAAVVGVGDEQGLGAALCRRFAAGGHHVLVAGRTAAKIDKVAAGIAAGGGSAEAVLTDATREDDIERLFDKALSPGPGRDPVDLIVANPGHNQRLDFREVSVAQFEDFWRIGCLAGFLIGREVARRVVPLERGTLIFSGASASLRGRPGYGHFSAAKAGLRMIAQSMAREYGPLGLHVAHVVIDGPIYSERVRNFRRELIAQRGEDGFLTLEPVAETYWHIYNQPRSTWTFELELRPYKEVF